MKFLHQIPFFRLTLFFIAGIVAQSHADIPDFLVIGCTCVAFLLFLFSFLPKINKIYKFRFLFGAGLALLLFASATLITRNAWKKSEWQAPADTCLYRAVIIDEPVTKPKTRMCRIRIIAAEKAAHSKVAGKKAVIYLPTDSISQQLVAGDCLLFYGKLEEAPPYLKKQSVAASGFIRKKQWRLENGFAAPFSILTEALTVRRILLAQLQTMISDRQSYAVAAALMFGYRNELDNSLVQSFRNTGAAHILAISGTHFAILFGMLYFVLSFTGNSRKAKKVKQLILQPMVWGFAFLTGFSPSVVRAALMLSLWGVGEAFSYRSFTLNTVAVAAFFMLLFQPLYFYDVGFQLSFLAVIAIVLIHPYLVKLYESRNLIIQYIWNLCCVSVAAQIGVLPLSVYYFHQIPALFLLTNLFLLPLSAILLFLVPVSMLLHAVFGHVNWLLFPLNKSIDLFVSITKALDGFSGRNINDLYISFWDMSAAFLAMALLALVLVKKRVVYLYLLLILVAFQIIYYL